ncbi:hypothetical protein RHMOL_Rhmol11G0058400 [Rhododendron molle]|uniref:Uncharacterized protein n=1 Tax=Rhododendron molle TaxID=49168 RepID=A0ACC0LQ22_RHOML|nr:hypothetical protein RHMOL_Rhmol11G0058400 [Rhododendron molle]
MKTSVSESRSPVRVKSGQGPVPVLRTVDLANQRLRSAKHFLVQNDVILARQISTVDLRDQRLGALVHPLVRISLGHGILGERFTLPRLPLFNLSPHSLSKTTAYDRTGRG